MSESTIEWTDKTWNPIRGCTRVSSGCVNCYAERTAARFAGPSQPYEGLVSVRSKVSGLRYDNPRGAGSWSEPRWTGKVAFVEDKLDEPLRWRKPARIFVNSMSDLFHEDLTNEQIAAVFSVMAAASHHTFQVLTKRPKRMREFFAWLESEWPKQEPGNEGQPLDANVVHEYRRDVGCIPDWFVRNGEDFPAAWPLPNVWLGVSVENQKAADERIPQLLATPAAVRFLSVEPLLGPVDLRGWGDDAPAAPTADTPATWADFVWPEWVPHDQRRQIEGFWGKGYGRSPASWLADHVQQRVPATGSTVTVEVDAHGWAQVDKMASSGLTGRYLHAWNNIGRIICSDGKVVYASGGHGAGWLSKWLPVGNGDYSTVLHWVIVGGESGPGARPCDLAWIRRVVDDCKSADVPVFVKQLGAAPVTNLAPTAETRDGPNGKRQMRMTADFVTVGDRKGGNPDEWPADLRVRQFPKGGAR